MALPGGGVVVVALRGKKLGKMRFFFDRGLF